MSQCPDCHSPKSIFLREDPIDVDGQPLMAVRWNCTECGRVFVQKVLTLDPNDDAPEGEIPPLADPVACKADHSGQHCSKKQCSKKQCPHKRRR